MQKYPNLSPQEDEEEEKPAERVEEREPTEDTATKEEEGVKLMKVTGTELQYCCCRMMWTFCKMPLVHSLRTCLSKLYSSAHYNVQNNLFLWWSWSFDIYTGKTVRVSYINLLANITVSFEFSDYSEFCHFEIMCWLPKIIIWEFLVSELIYLIDYYSFS